uniref:cytochrome P450 2C31-like isoform X1 n=2 Tax=Styela clava TaxID=7725 RepID=UPI00193AD822|nr:cytochrome P450 2C31-like isoform X1 [Styela clava]
MDILTLLTLFSFILFVYFYHRGKRTNFPPGPMGLPFVGFAPFLGENPAITYMKLGKKYGSIFSVRIGSKDWIVLNDYKSILGAYAKNEHAFSGRPDVVMLQVLTGFGHGMGLIDYGEMWESQRVFEAKALRGISARRGVENAVVDEIRHLNEIFCKSNEQPIDPKIHFGKAVANTVMNITIGQRLPYDDERFIEIVTRLKDYWTDETDGKLFGIMFFFPVLRHLPKFRTTFAKFCKSVKRIKEMIKEYVDEHKLTFDPRHPRDFIDEFLVEAQKEQQGNFTDVQLIHAVNEFFNAGIETTTDALLWIFLELAQHPESQTMIDTELLNVIGRSGTPSWKHKNKMPYTSAFIQEVERVHTMAPLSMPRKTTSCVQINGYEIPKDTPVMPNFWAVHRDPKLFENPDEFLPERFLDEGNNFLPSKYVIAFSVGPRNCMGEQIARKEMFLFIVGILQHFRIEADQKAYSLPPTDKGVYGIAYSPLKYKVRFIQK